MSEGGITISERVLRVTGREKDSYSHDKLSQTASITSCTVYNIGKSSKTNGNWSRYFQRAQDAI